MNNSKYILRFIFDGEEDFSDEKYDNEISLIMRLLSIINHMQTKGLSIDNLGYTLKVMKSETIHTEIRGHE
mgnify:CR=1 FL=1